MNPDATAIDKIKQIYPKIHLSIQDKLCTFNKIWVEDNETAAFLELAFCLFTPQSKAEACWETVLLLKKNRQLLVADEAQLSRSMARVRFRNTKARYLVEARQQFIREDQIRIIKELKGLPQSEELRQWLVSRVKGFGLKEASHFLRNIGASFDYAILDRHILKQMQSIGILADLPNSLSAKTYQQIEQLLIRFSESVQIPMGELDLLFWFIANGKLFK